MGTEETARMLATCELKWSDEMLAFWQDCLPTPQDLAVVSQAVPATDRDGRVSSPEAVKSRGVRYLHAVAEHMREHAVDVLTMEEGLRPVTKLMRDLDATPEAIRLDWPTTREAAAVELCGDWYATSLLALERVFRTDLPALASTVLQAARDLAAWEFTYARQRGWRPGEETE